MNPKYIRARTWKLWGVVRNMTSEGRKVSSSTWTTFKYIMTPDWERPIHVAFKIPISYMRHPDTKRAGIWSNPDITNRKKSMYASPMSSRNPSDDKKESNFCWWSEPLCIKATRRQLKNSRGWYRQLVSMCLKRMSLGSLPPTNGGGDLDLWRSACSSPESRRVDWKKMLLVLFDSLSRIYQWRRLTTKMMRGVVSLWDRWWWFDRLRGASPSFLSVFVHLDWFLVITWYLFT